MRLQLQNPKKALGSSSSSDNGKAANESTRKNVNVFLLGLAFFFTFTAFFTMGNMQVPTTTYLARYREVVVVVVVASAAAAAVAVVVAAAAVHLGTRAYIY